MQYKTAHKIAIDLLLKLGPYVNKINIAGSIRRQKAEVGDIEIVCLPLKQATGQAALFEGDGEVAVVPEFEKLVLSLGNVKLGNVNGRYMCIYLPESIKLDLFMPQPHDYYRIFAIRTGSSTYSSVVIATAWKKKGWCGTEHGLRRISDCRETGSTWKWINRHGELPPVWESEGAFFKWLDIPYLDPRLREIASQPANNQKEAIISQEEINTAHKNKLISPKQHEELTNKLK